MAVFITFLMSLAVFVSFPSAALGAGKQKREAVVVQTKLGLVEGEVFVSDMGFQVDGFRGIPYAEPPLGDLMFQKPRSLKPWEGVRRAKQWPNRCIQSWILGEVLPKLDSDSTDCLYLNIFSPHVKSASFPGRFPVMLWIHGGAYHFGSSVEYGLKGIVHRIVPKNVVFVTIHYRLGSYGFFATGDSVAPGNLGLWDQTAALRWIHENIASFNGDPSRVTVFGESAGAGSTALLTLSPHSNHLFHQAILMSGTHLAPWAQNQGPLKFSRMLAEELNCNLSSSELVLSCMKSKTPTEISEAEKHVAETVKYEAAILFNPVMDNDFFPEPFEQLISKAPVKPTVAGTTHDELGLFTTPPSREIQTGWAVLDETYSYESFKKFLTQVFPDRHFKNAPLLRRLALHHYIHMHSEEKNNSFLVDQYTKLFNDFFMFYPQYLDAQQRSAAGSPVWLYSFDYFSSAAFPSGHRHKGAFHLMELTYLFDSQLFQPFLYNEWDKQMLEMMTTLWTNFAKYGNPTPQAVNGVYWYPVSSAAPGRYLSIKTQPELKPFYHCECMAFWEQLLPDIESLDLFRPLRNLENQTPSIGTEIEHGEL